MKTNLLYCLIILLSLGFASCDQEEIINEDPVIIIDPPTEVGYPVAIGVVTGEAGALEGATVSVFQAGILKGQTMSDEEGAYSTIDIETEEDEDLILVFEKEEYSAAYRKRSGESLKSSKLAVQLLTEDAVYGVSASISNPNADDFVSLSGYVKDLQGNGGRGQVAVEWMDGSTYWGGTTATDDSGYFEILVGKDVEVRVSIFADTICFAYLTEEEVRIFLNLQAEVMGPFSSDVVLADYTNAYSQGRGFEVGGQILKCDGSQTNFSSVSITVEDSDGSSYTQVLDNLDAGQFSLVEDECISIPYTVSIVGTDQGSQRTTDTLTINVTDAIYVNNSIQLQACNDINVGSSSAVMTVGGVDYTFNDIIARTENGNLVADSLTLSYARFTIPNVTLGQNTIQGLDMASWDTGAYFKAVNDVMTCDVTALTSNSATVTVTGDFIDGTSGVVNGTCVLNLKF